MHLPEAQWQLRQLIEHVVTIEGPVLDTLVLRRAREAWGVGRAGQTDSRRLRHRRACPRAQRSDYR